MQPSTQTLAWIMRLRQIETPHDALKWLALAETSHGELAKCWPLLGAICKELKVPTPPRETALDGRQIAILEHVITSFVNDNRVNALHVITEDPFSTGPKPCQIISAVGEVLAISYGELDREYREYGGVFDYLRRKVRGVSDAEWKLKEDTNRRKKMRQTRAAIWLRQDDEEERGYSYRGLQDHENDYLSAFLSALQVYLQDADSGWRSELGAEATRAAFPSHGEVYSAESQLLSIPDYPNTADQRTTQGIPGLPAWYIRRPVLERELIDLIEQGHKAIALTGLPGMGKSSLAEAVAYTLNGDASDVAWVSVQDGRLSLPDLSAMANSTAVSRSASQTSGPTELLAIIVSSPQAPRFLILDNLNDTDELHQLVPKVKSSTVIATCRYVGKIDPRPWRVLEVGRMNDAEAQALIGSLLPGFPDTDITRLADITHGYPLVAAFAAGLIDQCGLSVDQFEEDMKTGAATVLGNVEAGDKDRLSVVLQRIVEACRERDPLAYEALVVLGLAHHGMSLSFLAENLREVGATSVSRCAQAVKVLRDFRIVNSRPHRREDVVCHPLIRELLEGLLVNQIRDVAYRCLRAMRRYLKSAGESDDGRTIPALVLLYTTGVLDSFFYSADRGALTPDFSQQRDRILNDARIVGRDVVAQIDKSWESGQEHSAFDVELIERYCVEYPEALYGLGALIGNDELMSFADRMMASLPPREEREAIIAELRRHAATTSFEPTTEPE